MRVLRWQTFGRVTKVSQVGPTLGLSTIDRSGFFYERTEYEHICWDPKDGELCLNRVKPEETLVEARSDSDVQIDRQIWV